MALTGQIGSGLAGLTTAHYLSQRGFPVEIFEKEGRIGVDAASVIVNVVKDGKSCEVAIDVPMRSIDAGKKRTIRRLMGGYYPRLLGLLKELDVAVRPDDLTFTFSREKSRTPYLIYNGLSGVQGLTVPSTKSYLLSIMEIIYYSIGFVYLCIVSLLHYHLHFFPRIKKITFEGFCEEYFIPQKFAREVLVPLYSGVCTCKEEDILKYPAGLIVGMCAFCLS